MNKSSTYIPFMFRETTPKPTIKPPKDTVLNKKNFFQFWLYVNSNDTLPSSLEITNITFYGFVDPLTHIRYGGLRIPALYNIFKALKKIKGTLTVTAYHKNFTNLSFLKNLNTIGGHIGNVNFSLEIRNTSIEYLGLDSLTEISNGGVLIEHNTKLWSLPSEDYWAETVKDENASVSVRNNKPTFGACDEECDGCLGSGPSQCKACKHFLVEKTRTCVKNCDPLSQFQHENLCKECSRECIGCTGPLDSQCLQCRRKLSRDKTMCIPRCALNEFAKGVECQTCHEDCFVGCSGPQATVGVDGCKPCPRPVLGRTISNHNTKCLNLTQSCPDFYFEHQIFPEEEDQPKMLRGKQVCKPCYNQCSKCTSYGKNNMFCQKCTNKTLPTPCSCSSGEFYNNYYNFLGCEPCHEECNECIGSGDNNCLKCKNKRVFEGVPKITGEFTCKRECPIDQPTTMFDPKYENYCSPKLWVPARNYSNFDNYSSLLLLAICAFFIAIGFKMWKRSEVYKSKVKVKEMLDIQEPLVPSNVSPNMSKLYVIKESDVKKGIVLGSGAFGTVYKGRWLPKGEKAEIAVAIKVVKAKNENTTKELLEEAGIMARMNHPYLVRLLAVCVTTNMMLITQLMPLGSLEDYVSKHNVQIKPEQMLNWFAQIAKGMAFLEANRVVHRDLAARNVLVQTPNHVRVTDFGLSRGLEEEVYKSKGGKLPIKWLAVESVKQGIFTTKSDVWSFGITIWEILTYGSEPFDDIPFNNFIAHLESGNRLSQPDICTVELYSVLITCWSEEVNGRPTFDKLSDVFTRMTRDPVRYIVLPEDVINNPLPLRQTNSFAHLEEPDHPYESIDLCPSSYENVFDNNEDVSYENLHTYKNIGTTE